MRQDSYHDVGTELVGLVLERRVLLKHNTLDIVGRLADSLCNCQLKVSQKVCEGEGITHIKHVRRDLGALLRERPQLLEESVRDLLRGLKGSMRSGTDRAVNVGRLVDDVLDNRLGLMKHWSETLPRINYYVKAMTDKRTAS